MSILMALPNKWTNSKQHECMIPLIIITTINSYIIYDFCTKTKSTLIMDINV